MTTQDPEAWLWDDRPTTPSNGRRVQGIVRPVRQVQEELPAPQPVSAVSQFIEADACYRAEARMEASRKIAKRAVNGIAATHEDITARARGDRYLEVQLRRVEETLSYSASEFLARYILRP